MGRYEDYNEMLYEAYCKAAIDNAILKADVYKRQVPIVRPFQLFRMRGAAKKQEHVQFRDSFGFPTDPFPTLLASDVAPFAFWYEDDPLGGCIRFPTERECERMMGLPEGWTQYGADGDPIRPMHRYRALGLSLIHI